MESTGTGWWHRHGWTFALLLAAFGLAFSIRTIWSYPVIARWGALYVYAGGSDSYYHSRVMQYIILTGHNLIHDPMLKYPIGGTNPREPLFDWMNAILGLLFAPFFGGSAVAAGAWFLDLQAPLWAALEVFPLYLIGREVSSKRTGLFAAMILPFLSASIDSSTFGYANYLSFYTFMILVVVYAYIRTVKALGTHRYVQSYAHPEQFWPALKAFYHREHTAVKWGVFTGVSLGALALSWQGYTYAIVVVGFTLVIAMVVERIRGHDSFGLYVTTWIIALVAIPMATPYYFVQGTLRTFFDLPVLLLFGTLLLTLPFLLMRDIPWVFSIPSLVAVVGVAALGLALFFPTFFADIVTGQGYFVKTLIYSTVAEAQPPSFDALVLGYGVATFFLAFVGIAVFVYLLIRHRFKRYHIALLVYGVLSVYLPITATKFFLVGAPAYALLSAEALHRALDVGRYPELRRTVASLSDRRSQFAAFRRAFKPRHVLILALVVMILLPNVWISIDAGVPGNTKNAVAVQINKTIPSFLKLNASEPAGNYLGAAGTELDTPNQYDYAAYTWLSQQDTNVPEPQRPAFVSWWDYGFQAIDQGGHPSVADNFQNGIDPSGQFLLSQNESLAIGVLATTLLIAEESKTHQKHLPAALNAILASDGVNVTTLQGDLANQANDYAIVVAHPDIYLPVDPSTITDDNAMYLVVSHYLASTRSLSNVAEVYDAVQQYTGWSIRYAMVDSRLFPFSGTDTGIFYAPADLTGRPINSAGLPTSFFNVTVLGSNNETYALGNLPASVAAERYEINYFAPFYNSMLYKIYIGYNGTEVGQDGGIPGLSGAAASDRLEPGFMLQHFEVVYHTAYYCAGVKNATNSSSCMLPANAPTAKSLAKSTDGTYDGSAVSYFEGGETMLAYYPGETLDGTVALPNGAPDAGVRVTVYDSWGIPHMTAITSATGAFSLVLPPGNDTLNITTGKEDLATQAGASLLKSIPIDVSDALGYSFNTPALIERFTLAPATVQGTVYWNTANNTSYEPSRDQVVAGAQVAFTAAGKVATLTATTDASGTFVLPNAPAGNYTYTVTYKGHQFNETNVLVKPGATANASAGLSPASISGSVSGPGGQAIPDATITLSDAAGLVETVHSGSSGSYSFGSLGPGNYTVLASVPGTTERSVHTPTAVTSEGQAVTLALSVRPMASVTVLVSANSVPVAGVAVRFSSQLSFAATGGAPVNGFSTVADNGTVALTNAEGTALVALAPGNYSVYAVGYAAENLEAAIATLEVPRTGLPPVIHLALTSAVALSGAVSSTNKSGSGVVTAVEAVAPTGAQVIGLTASNGSYRFELPAGPYTVYALAGPTVGSNGKAPGASVALARLNLTAATVLPLSVGASTAAKFVVYANVTSDTTLPVAGATVTISLGPDGAGVRQTSGANGSIIMYLPTSLAGASGGLCLSASAPGYAPAQSCGYTPARLAVLPDYRLDPTPVPVTLTVTGLPTGTSVEVNLTSKSATAVSRSFSGGPRFSFEALPGNYSVTAFASTSGGSVEYATAAPRDVRLAFGARSVLLNLTVVPEILARGTLSLPSGTTPENTSITLTSSALSVTVNGTDYEKDFRIAVGPFTASLTGTGTSGKTENLTAVTVTSGGTITPRLVLNRPGVKLTGSLVTSSGGSLALNGTVTLRSTTGATILASATRGHFSSELPSDHNFTASANVTVLSAGSNGSYRVTWSTAAGVVCRTGTTASTCSVPMSSTRDRAWLNGTIERTSTSGAVPSQLRVVGPYPSTNLSVVAVDNGTFSLPEAPGAYYLYATPQSGAPDAGFAQALALPGAPAVTITLVATTVDRITVVASAATGQTLGSATLTVGGAGGSRLLYDDVSLGTTVPVALPPGTYAVHASASGTLNGVAGTASTLDRVTISAAGNLATRVVLGIAVDRKVTGRLSGPHDANVTAGSTTTFSFSVTDSGNVPVTVHPVGAPSFWQFNFTRSVTNVTLAPGGAASGAVRIVVPAGTVVDHAPVAITFETVNGTSVGNVTPAPQVHVAAYSGLVVGHAQSQPTSSGAASARVPFFVKNTGNVAEEVALSLENAPHLATLGWGYAFKASGATNRSIDVNVSAGDNTSYSLNLTFYGTTYIAPGAVTITGAVVGATAATSGSVTVDVPMAKLTVVTSHGHALTITGPGIGSSSTYPTDWELLVLALLPAGLVLALIVGRRWWTTRRWSRW